MPFLNKDNAYTIGKTLVLAFFLTLFISLPSHASVMHTFGSPPDMPDILEGARRSECSVADVESLEPVLASLLRLGGSERCSNEYVVEFPRTEELCHFENIGTIVFEDLDFSEEEFDGPIPVSVELDSYRLNRRAIYYVNRNIKILSKDIPDRFAVWLARSGRYIRMMRNIIREEGLPEDMVWLPLIESGFNTRAYSRSHAAGPWQFIKSTGKRYGLKIDYWVDERRDPVKSTRAAARYLNDLYEMFGSWSLAMAAYNAGEGRIKRALKHTKSHDFWGLLQTRHIRSETKNYVPKFIAARMIAVEPEKYGFQPIEYHDDFTYDEVVINRPLSLDVAAKCAGITTKDLKNLNPELRRWSTPPVKQYVLRIPRGSRETFEANLKKIPHNKRLTVKVHTVRSGDNLWDIARAYGVTIRDLKQYNKIGRRNLIRPGQKLIIPVALRRS